MSLVECFKSIINAAFHLNTAPRPESIVVQEKGGNDNGFSLTFVGGKNISYFGFVVEAGDPEPLALLGSQNTPGVGLTGIRKMCDGIIIFSQGEREYVLGVELKSGDTQDAHKQIRNGEILCEWLSKLLKEYGHWNGSYKFCDVIAKHQRRTSNKGTTKHNGHHLKVERNNGRNILNIRNSSKEYLLQIARSIDQA